MSRVADLFLALYSQLVVLSGAALLLVPAMAVWVFGHPRWRFLIVISLVGFGLTMMGGVVFQWGWIVAGAPAAVPPSLEIWVVLAYWSFLIAVVSLVLFTTLNLLSTRDES